MPGARRWFITPRTDLVTGKTPYKHSAIGESANGRQHGIGEHNYCRNPGDHTQPWCNVDPLTCNGKTWESCDPIT